MSIEAIIDGIIEVEGGYVNDPNDAGGETNWGITVKVARLNGYHGPMRDMPRSVAEGIYRNEYVTGPGFDRVIPLSERIAEELVDTGVNMGQAVAGRFLQQALNGLNRNQKDYPDLTVDGGVGPMTARALEAYLDARGPEAEEVMLKALNCLQGARYINITEARPQNEDFLFGWLRARVTL